MAERQGKDCHRDRRAAGEEMEVLKYRNQGFLFFGKMCFVTVRGVIKV